MDFKYLSPKQLYDSLHKFPKNSKTLHEALSALTVLAAYDEMYEIAKCAIGFPVKANLLKLEFDRLPNDLYELREYIEDDSLEDVVIKITEKSSTIHKLKLQMKRVDRRVVSNSLLMISLLEKYKKKYAKSNSRLVLIYEQIPKLKSSGRKFRIKFPVLEDWFNKNNFPFMEIILVHFEGDKHKTINLFQFWSKMIGPCRQKNFTIEKIKKILSL